eukprot:m.155028 g.155028  ORF g.155028 m.155028 type:complete len:83 (+) comp38651_c0_seq14:28-276(+)
MQDMDRDRDRLRLLQRSLFGYWFRRLLMDYYVLVPTKWRYSLEVLSTTKVLFSFFELSSDLSLLSGCAECTVFAVFSFGLLG